MKAFVRIFKFLFFLTLIAALTLSAFYLLTEFSIVDVSGLIGNIALVIMITGGALAGISLLFMIIYVLRKDTSVRQSYHAGSKAAGLMMPGIVVLLAGFVLQRLGERIDNYINLKYLIICLGAFILVAIIFLILSATNRKKAKKEKSRPRLILADDAGLSPIRQEYMKERNALLNIINLIEKHGYNEECIMALVERFPSVERVLEEITKLAEYDPNLQWDLYCLNLFHSADEMLSSALIYSDHSQAELSKTLFRVVEILYEAIGEPSEDFLRIQQEQAAADAKAADAKNQPFVAAYIPASDRATTPRNPAQRPMQKATEPTQGQEHPETINAEQSDIPAKKSKGIAAKIIIALIASAIIIYAVIALITNQISLR